MKESWGKICHMVRHVVIWMATLQLGEAHFLKQEKGSRACASHLALHRGILAGLWLWQIRWNQRQQLSPGMWQEWTKWAVFVTFPSTFRAVQELPSSLSRHLGTGYSHLSCCSSLRAPSSMSPVCTSIFYSYSLKWELWCRCLYPLPVIQLSLISLRGLFGLCYFYIFHRLLSYITL